jgi:uncharacterized protein YcfJ
MRNRLLTAVLSAGLLFGTALPGNAMVRHHRYYRSRAAYVRHKRHVNTAKRVGIGAAGGAGIGAVAGGLPGAAIGAIAGAGAGVLYDGHEKHHGHN